MTGWRVGWLLAPDELLDAVDRLVANVARYAENRALLLQALPAIGLDRLAPADGAFYVYADVSDHTEDSLAWVRDVLADTGVALAPGLDFDAVEGHRFARLSFAGDLVEIEQAVTVLGKYLQAGG